MTSLFKKIILKKKKTISFPLEEYWKDIGRLSDYETANKEFSKKILNLKILNMKILAIIPAKKTPKELKIKIKFY